MNFIKKSIAFTSMTMMMAGTFAPGVFAQGTDISGNGAFSSNIVTQTENQTDTTVQNNTATFNNTIDVSSNTGGNTADYNTGGNVGIGTGNSVTGVQITNMANLNTANSDPAVSAAADPQLPVTIQGNGAGSANFFSSTETQDQAIYQFNTATFNNSVAVDSNSGDNSAAYGTNGNTTILTGTSQTGIGIQNTANGNVAGSGLSVPSVATSGLLSASPVIIGNGALSSNSVDINNSNSALVEQFNDAVVTNSVSVAANTGGNLAEQNTGGSQMVQTGMATLTAGISNLANFNSANLPSDSFVSTVNPLIYGNGAYSANATELSQTRTNSLYQGDRDLFTANNALAFTPTTGDNAASLNTLTRNGVSHLLSGSSAASVSVNNSGNVNSSGTPLGRITLPGGTLLNLGFNLGNLFRL